MIFEGNEFIFECFFLFQTQGSNLPHNKENTSFSLWW